MISTSYKYCAECHAFLYESKRRCPACGGNKIVPCTRKGARDSLDAQAVERLMDSGRFNDAVKLCIDSGFNDVGSNYLMAKMLIGGSLDGVGCDDRPIVEYTGLAKRFNGEPPVLFGRGMSHLAKAIDLGLPREKVAELRKVYCRRAKSKGIFLMTLAAVGALLAMFWPFVIIMLIVAGFLIVHGISAAEMRNMMLCGAGAIVVLIGFGRYMMLDHLGKEFDEVLKKFQV